MMSRQARWEPHRHGWAQALLNNAGITQEQFGRAAMLGDMVSKSLPDAARAFLNVFK
jgi:hypothetical protein